MEILKQIQTDLISEKTPLSTILRKALILASQLKSEKLKEWINGELNGYKSPDNLPDYRVIQTSCVGLWTNGYWRVNNHQVPTWQIDDKKLKEYITVYRVYNGLKTVEEYSLNPDLNFFIPPEITAMVNDIVGDQGYVYAQIRYTIRSQHFQQILDTVKNRLLEFVLTLDEKWDFQVEMPSNSQLGDLLSVVIYNVQDGGAMSVFDQRGQKVNYQYNAVGDININSSQNIDDFIKQLEKLQAELKTARDAKAIEQEKAVEAEYHLLQATKETKKEKPNPKAVIDHLNEAKAFIEGVTSAAGLVTALTQAAELVGKLFK
ncbi:MAG: hypothetical protein HS100_19650 [Anaerolineales bacterium]|nr:hypothetical protein [Anaerolineales bacterium]